MTISSALLGALAYFQNDFTKGHPPGSSPPKKEFSARRVHDGDERRQLLVQRGYGSRARRAVCSETPLRKWHGELDSHAHS